MSEGRDFGTPAQEKDFHWTLGCDLPDSFLPSLSGMVYPPDRFREYPPFVTFPLYPFFGFLCFFTGIWRASSCLNRDQRQGYSFQSKTQRDNSKSALPFDDLNGKISRGL